VPGGGQFHGDLFDYFYVEAFEACHSLGMVGEKADSFEVEIGEDLGSETYFAMDLAFVFRVRGMAAFVMKAKEGLVADFFGSESLRVLVEIDESSTIFFGDGLQGRF